jgi:hypothetical protein
MDIKKISRLGEIRAKPSILVRCVFEKKIFLQNDCPRNNREQEQQK